MTLTTNKKTILLILIAFAFSFAVRLIWVQQFSDVEQFKFNGEFMINTNDGYFYAEGARDILDGKTELTNDRSPFESAGSVLTAWIANIVPFSFESVIFYLPAFLGSLIVIPIVLIGREFGKLEVGFIAALIGSIAWSYYNRTMIGYYDTDMLNIVFPTLLLWSLIWAIGKKEDIYLLFTALDILAYRWWYPQSYSLEFSFFGLILLYAIYQYIKKDDFKYTLMLLFFMMFAMIGLDGWIRLAIVTLLFISLKINRDLVEKYIYYIFAISIVLFLATGGIDPIVNKLDGYVFKSDTLSSTTGIGLHFFSVMQTVREAGQIPFETFANRISGDTTTFLLACVGYLWLSYRYRIMLIALPMVGLGFLALTGGLRFTIYAVPPLALGIAYLIYEVSILLSKQLSNESVSKVSKYVLMSTLTLAVLYPNIIHIITYTVPTVFTQNEVKVLDKFKTIATREDYAVSWWDYGFPLRYYSDVKTLVDGSKHSGSVNFPVSFVLNSPQEVSAKMARLDVEYTENRFAVQENNKDIDENDTKYIKLADTNIEQMILDYGYNDANDFLFSLETDISLPDKTRDVYLYLPSRMMGIFPTVTLFSNIDLMSGEKKARPFFYKTNTIQERGNNISLGNGITILKDKGQIQIGKQIAAINTFSVTQYDNKGVLQKQVQTLNKNGSINIIYMKNYNQFLVLDEKMYNSTYIQLFVLENYDKNLFEPVILDPLAKIFKLKI